MNDDSNTNADARGKNALWAFIKMYAINVDDDDQTDCRGTDGDQLAGNPVGYASVTIPQKGRAVHNAVMIGLSVYADYRSLSDLGNQTVTMAKR